MHCGGGDFIMNLSMVQLITICKSHFKYALRALKRSE